MTLHSCIPKKSETCEKYCDIALKNNAICLDILVLKTDSDNIIGSAGIYQYTSLNDIGQPTKLYALIISIFDYTIWKVIAFSTISLVTIILVTIINASDKIPLKFYPLSPPLNTNGVHDLSYLLTYNLIR